MTTSSRYPFPGFVLSNMDQFNAYQAAHTHILDHRYQFEETLASSSDITHSGICPLTLNRTKFRSSILNGDRHSGGKILPVWRYRQVCDLGLSMGERAVAHYALYNRNDAGLGKVLYLADSNTLEKALRRHSVDIKQIDFQRLSTVSETFDTILITSQFERLEDPNETLKTLQAMLKVGGVICFHINFHYFDATSAMYKREDGVYWGMGWDFLDALVNAGFARPHAVTFWAQETGYLGPYNFIFSASKLA